jgi:hypothetical protein
MVMSSDDPEKIRTWFSLHMHEFSDTAALRPPANRQPPVTQ